MREALHKAIEGWYGVYVPDVFVVFEYLFWR